MSIRLASKVVAITGASAGIGAACAVRCVAEGAAVALLARRADRLDALVATLTANGGRAVAIVGDVTCEDDVRRLVTTAVREFGKLDVMIANAGIGFHGGLDETPTDVMRRLLDVNVMGTFYAARAAREVFQRQGHGHLIAISSIVGRRGIGGSSAYSATKAAQIGLVESLRAEWLGSGLRASLVYPVATTTEFHASIDRDYGIKVSGRGPRQSAEEVAAAIADCIVKPRAEVYPLRKAWWLAVANVIAPARTDKIVQRFARRQT